jgi:hypothetical protein
MNYKEYQVEPVFVSIFVFNCIFYSEKAYNCNIYQNSFPIIKGHVLSNTFPCVSSPYTFTIILPPLSTLVTQCFHRNIGKADRKL